MAITVKEAVQSTLSNNNDKDKDKDKKILQEPKYVEIYQNSSKPPSHITILDQLPSLKGKPVKKTRDQFLKENNFNRLIDTIIIDPALLSDIEKAFALKWSQNPPEEGLILPQLLLQHSASTQEKIQLVNMGETGIGAFAKEKIKKDSVLLYAGVLRFEKDYSLERGKQFTSRVLKGNPDIFVDAEKYRNIAAFLQHLPSSESLEQLYQIEEKDWSEKVALGNFVLEIRKVKYKEYYILLPILVATRDILAGEIIGFDYRNIYWLGVSVEPHLFAKDGSIIPRNHYKAKNLNLKINIKPEMNNVAGYSSYVYLEMNLEWPVIKDLTQPRNTKYFYLYDQPGTVACGLTQADCDKLLQFKNFPYLSQDVKMDAVQTVTSQALEALAVKLTNLLAHILNISNVKKTWKVQLQGDYPLLCHQQITTRQAELIVSFFKNLGLENLVVFATEKSPTNTETIGFIAFSKEKVFDLAIRWNEIIKKNSYFLYFQQNKLLLQQFSIKHYLNPIKYDPKDFGCKKTDKLKSIRDS